MQILFVMKYSALKNITFQVLTVQIISLFIVETRKYNIMLTQYSDVHFK